MEIPLFRVTSFLYKFGFILWAGAVMSATVSFNFNFPIGALPHSTLEHWALIFCPLPCIIWVILGLKISVFLWPTQ